MKGKRKYFAAFLLLALLLAGGAMALSDGDSLISLRYLTDIFQPKAVEQGAQAAEKIYQAGYDAAKGELDKASQAYSASEDGRLYSADFRARTFKRGDVLTVEAGAGLTLLAGSVSAAHGGALVDVTAGAEVASGATLTAGHRYLAAEDTTASFTVKTGLVRLGIQGRYTLKESATKAAPYLDIYEGDWYTAAVDFAYEKGLFSGTGDDKFSPSQTMSRAMMTTVFYRLAGSPAEQMAQASAAFDDVADGSWYATFVRWAASQGITSGTAQTPPLFSPDRPVTREQVAVMLYGFASKGLGKTLSGQADLSVYSDRDRLSEWAAPAVSWAVANGILSASSGQLLPGQNANRAQVALMVKNFSEKIM